MAQKKKSHDTGESASGLQVSGDIRSVFRDAFDAEGETGARPGGGWRSMRRRRVR
jgi:hypothetical protein